MANEAEQATRTVKSGLIVPWAGLSLALGVITLTAVGTLVVVTSVQDIDVLSTVALALAVLSFAAQLIVTMAQSEQSSKVNGETLSALADMRATTSSLLSNQRDQFDKVLGAALRQAIPAAVEDLERAEGLDPESPSDGLSAEQWRPALEQALEIRFAELLSPAARTVSADPIVNYGPRTRKREELLLEFPSQEEATPILPILQTLSPKQFAALGKFVTDWVTSRRADGDVSYTRTVPLDQSAFQGLANAGVLTQKRLSENKDGKGTVVYDLTPEGVIAARILRGRGEPPDWARPIVG